MMLIQILRPDVLVGSQIYQEGNQVEVDRETGKRLTKEPNPAARMLKDQGQPEIAQLSQQPGQVEGSNNLLTLERLVATGIPPKQARILIDAGVHSRQQLTLDHLITIEGIGEKSAESIVALVNKPEGN